METKFLKIKDIAKNLGVSVMTIYREIDEGRLKARRIGRSYRIEEKDYAAYLEAAKVQPDEGMVHNET